MRATPPSKIKDFAHLPLHRGGFPLRRGWAKRKLFGTTGTAGGFLYTKKAVYRTVHRFFADERCSPLHILFEASAEIEDQCAV